MHISSIAQPLFPFPPGIFPSHIIKRILTSGLFAQGDISKYSVFHQLLRGTATGLPGAQTGYEAAEN